MNKVVAVDIDGTLWGRTGLNLALLAKLKEVKAAGYQLMLWSARGTDYARAFEAQHIEAGLFDVVIGKPMHVADDRGWDWVRYTRPLSALRTPSPGEGVS